MTHGTFKSHFDNLDEIQNHPGLYKIYTIDGTPLKVGIAVNLRKRLKQHARSLQRRLKPKIADQVHAPRDLQSKQSILAKHLYFDRSLTDKYDLTTELGRQAFLTQQTYLLITYTKTREEARELEKIEEASGIWRYQGRVKIID